MVHKNDIAFVINTSTNTYESYSGIFDSIIPDECRTEYDMRYIGSTSSGLVGYVSCYTMKTDSAIKFTLTRNDDGSNNGNNNGNANSILPPGTIYQDADGKVYVINTATQYTTYTSDGTCTTWPYYQVNGNIFMTVHGTLSMTKTGSNLVGIDMSDSSNTTFTIITSNPHASKCNATKSNYDTYSNIVDTFQQGDIFQQDDGDDSSFV